MYKCSKRIFDGFHVDSCVRNVVLYAFLLISHKDFIPHGCKRF